MRALLSLSCLAIAALAQNTFLNGGDDNTNKIVPNSGSLPSGISIPKQLYIKGGAATYDAITKKLVRESIGSEAFLD